MASSHSSSSVLSLFVTGGLLLAGLLLLTMIRLDHRDPSARRPAEEAGPVMADARGPTLAPPRRAVVVRVETDRPELEIGWLEQF